MKRRGVLLILGSLLGCGNSGHTGLPENGRGVETVKSALTMSPRISRVIPIRFVQFYASPNTGATATDRLQLSVDEANDALAKVGIQLVMRAPYNHPSAVFSNTRTSDAYTWPTWAAYHQTPASAELIQDLNCSEAQYNLLLASLSPPNRTEAANPDPDSLGGEMGALSRGAAYCAPDGEILVYVFDDWSVGSGRSNGFVPGHSNLIAMGRGTVDFGPNVGPRFLAHELGHYLGGVPDEVSGGNLTSTYYDMVYVPGTPNLFFSDASSAAPYEGRFALKDQGASGVSNIQFCTVNTAMGGCPSVANCPRSHLNTGDVRMDINGTTYYTGDPALSGISINPGGTSPAVNAMWYGYSYLGCLPPAVIGNVKVMYSDSYADQIRKDIREDVPNPLYPGSTSRRSWLGVGQGRWTEWESLGIQSTRPGVSARSGQAVAISNRNYDGVTAFACSTNGTNTLVSWLVGSSWLGRASIAIAGTNPQLMHMAAMSSGGLAEFRSLNLTTGDWSPTTGWGAISGVLSAAPSVAGRLDGHLDVVGSGSEYAAYFHTWKPDGTWTPSSGWQYIGGSLMPGSAPVVGERGSSTDVVAWGSDKSILFKSLTGSTWSPGTTTWDSSLGTSDSPPALGERPGGRADVAVRAGNQICFNTRWESGSWSGWGCFGSTVWGTTSPIVGTPSVASWSADRLDIVGRTADGNVIYKYFDEQAGKWWPSIDEWANLGSKATGPEGDPVIVTTDTNRLAIFVLADDGNLYVRVRDQ